MQLHTRLGVAEGRTWDTGGQHIVQSGRLLLVEAHEYLEGGLDSNIENFGRWVAAGDMYLVCLIPRLST